jgi:predicted nucleic acid-binding protein
LILVDTNVLLDLVEGGQWADWSRTALSDAQATGRPFVNQIVRAEAAGHFTSLQEQSEYLADIAIDTVSLDNAGAFRAGQAFRAYRNRGGARTQILADFLIGGHAAALGAALLTRDRQRFATYFPELTLITPETDHG